MNKAENIDWEHHVRLHFYEMEDSMSLERMYQAFKARFLREQAEEKALREGEEQA